MSDNEAHRRIWNDPDVRLEMVSDSKDSRELLDDGADRCEVCERVLSREEVKRNISLCNDCAARIDRDTDEQLEREHFDWFE
jgi:acetyl-CoA carboxylase beta subunit